MVVQLLPPHVAEATSPESSRELLSPSQVQDLFVAELSALSGKLPDISDARLVRRVTQRVASKLAGHTEMPYDAAVSFFVERREALGVRVTDPSQVRDYVLHLFRETPMHKCRNVTDQCVVLHPQRLCSSACSQYAKRLSSSRAALKLRRCPDCLLSTPAPVCDYCDCATEAVAPPDPGFPRVMPWTDYEFELLVALYFAEREAAKDVLVSAPGADGGVDIEMVLCDADGTDVEVAVQVKGTQVPSLSSVRDFVTAARGFAEGIFVSRTSPSAGMYEVAASSHVTLLGPRELFAELSALATYGTLAELEDLCRSAGVVLEADLR